MDRQERMKRMGLNSLYTNAIAHPNMPEDATPLMKQIVQRLCGWNSQWSRASTHLERDFLLNMIQKQYQSFRNGYNVSQEQREAISALVEAEVIEIDNTFAPTIVLINWE